MPVLHLIRDARRLVEYLEPRARSPELKKLVLRLKRHVVIPKAAPRRRR